MSSDAKTEFSNQQPALAPVKSPVDKLRVFDSQHLFSGALEVGILHENSVYRLKVTKQGKLILNK